jgi:hypothetical protein
MKHNIEIGFLVKPDWSEGIKPKNLSSWLNRYASSVLDMGAQTDEVWWGIRRLAIAVYKYAHRRGYQRGYERGYLRVVEDIDTLNKQCGHPCKSPCPHCKDYHEAVKRGER